MPLPGVPEMVGAEVTVIEKGGSEALEGPSATLITMPAYVPAFAAVGLPESRPVLVSNVAHEGLPAMENVRVPPAASEALGWNEYACPTSTEVSGVPEMTGGGGGGVFATVIENAGSEALPDPSLTLMTIPGSVPTFAAAGVPAN